MWFSVPLQVWLLLLGMFTFVYWYIRNQFSFWAKRGVPFSKPHWFFGNTGGWMIARISIADLLQNVYREFKGEKFCGIWRFFTPTLVVIDPEMINNILVKDAETWSSRGILISLDTDPLSANLVSLDGEEWKTLRTHSSPAYTPGKLKRMFEVLVECGKSLEEYLNNQVMVDDGVIDVGEMCRKFMVDVNVISGLGIQLDSLNTDDSFYWKIRKELFEPSLKRRIIMVMQIVSRRLLNMLKISFRSPEITDFWVDTVKQNLEYRDKNNLKKLDFLEFLRTSQNIGKPATDVETKCLAAQLFDFFIAAFEFTIRAVGYTLHELSVNQDIQDRVREEVRTTKAAYDGKLTWDAMNSMKYLDMVVQEILRKYPVTLLLRMCVKPYRIPNTNVELPTGTMCYIPTHAVHHDPEYYPDPEKFDPERFTSEAKSQRPPCTYLPFGLGPRSCIGSRFGDHQLKVALITIIDNFKVSLCEKSQNPFEFDPRDVLLSPTKGIWLRFSKDSSNSKADG